MSISSVASFSFKLNKHKNFPKFLYNLHNHCSISSYFSLDTSESLILKGLVSWIGKWCIHRVFDGSIIRVSFKIY